MAFDVFLKVDGAEGESTDEKHAGWIELQSFSFGASQPSSGARSTSGFATGERVNISDLTVVKNVDKATTKLFLQCCKGDPIASIEMEVCRATGDKTPYLKYKLSNSIVSSVSTSGAAGGGDLPMESVSFNFGKIELHYEELDHETGSSKGGMDANWDLTTNKGG